MNWTHYNPDKTPAGLECRYKIDRSDLYIEIPGTDSLYDWIVNVLFAFTRRKKLGEYKVHRGWYFYAFLFFRHITRVIDNNDVTVVFITGHSLGGAVAAILSELLIQRCSKIHIIGTSTYGAPRSGVHVTMSVYNRGDIVRFLPPWYPRNRDVYFTYRPRGGGIVKTHLDYEWRYDV